MTRQRSLQRNESGLHDIQKHIRQEAKGNSGILKTNQAFNCLNDLLRAEDPDAFESDIVQLHRRKVAERERIKAIE